MRRQIEKPAPLIIAVIGYNREQTSNALSDIANGLRSEGRLRRYSPSLGIVVEDNGNHYLTVNRIPHDGTIFDQLIIVDDNRWKTIQERADLIIQVVNRIDENIPENYKVQFMEV